MNEKPTPLSMDAQWAVECANLLRDALTEGARLMNTLEDLRALILKKAKH